MTEFPGYRRAIPPTAAPMRVIRTGEPEREAAAPRFELRLWGDIGQAVQPDRLVLKLLGERSLAALCGPPGCGKSFLALTIALAVARAVPLFGRAVTRGAVLYVSAEGHGGFANRLIAYRQHHGAGGDVPFAYIAAAPDLGPEGRDADHIIAAAKALAEIAGLAVALIIVDTVNRSLGGGDENSSADMGAFIAACDRIRIATSATILVVHHTGKDTARGMRGHSSLLGACDTVVTVERIDEGATRTATVTKQKDGADGETIIFELRPVEVGADEAGEPITSCVVVESDDGKGSNPERRRSLPTSQRRALDLLIDAIAREGEPLPERNDIPRGFSGTTVETWRRHCYERDISTSDDPSARRKAFGRAAQALMSRGLVGKSQDFVWIVP